MQAWLDSDLDFMLENLHKPPELKIFIMYGAYEINVNRRKSQNMFISVAYDSLTNTDTMYDEEFQTKDRSWEHIGSRYAPGDNRYTNALYAGDIDLVYPHIAGSVGLKIRYVNPWDTVNFYNRLLSVLEYALQHLEQIKSEQKQICFQTTHKGWDISILTYDTAKLKAIPIKDWGLSIYPEPRHNKKNGWLIVFAVVVAISLIFLLVKFRSIRKINSANSIYF